MSLRHSYRLLAPVYDLLVERALHDTRISSLSRLNGLPESDVLVNGIGTGLDIPLLPDIHHYTGTDITPAMLAIAERRCKESSLAIDLQLADSMALPFEDSSFDHVIMHLILAVVPRPADALAEASRVLKPGGSIFILDKFLRPGQRAPFRRTLNVFMRHIATRTDVVFEDVLATSSDLDVVNDVDALAGGWFRLIELNKQP